MKQSPTKSQATSAMLSVTDSMGWSLVINSKTKSVQEARLRERAKRYGFQLAAANEVLYHTHGP